VALSGCMAVDLGLIRDDEAAITAAITEGAATCDAVITSGGVSMGDIDLVKVVLDRIGEMQWMQIAIRPAKPFAFGLVGERRTPVLGLPGNPVSSIVCCHLFLLPMLRAMQGRPDVAPLPRRARLGCDIAPNGPRAHYMRATLSGGADLPQIAPFPMQDSALLRVLAQADALLIRPVGDPGRLGGEVVTYLPL